ncbi:MAG: hypothetical protein HYS13_17040 [Planctomycetia bacterium]|nr:hypothetical protein [Planctomycetia bacterium]
MRASISILALLWLAIPIPATAGILGQQSLNVDLTNAKEAKTKVTWSEPERIAITEKGLGWDGETNALRDGWIQTEPLAIGVSWRPAQGSNVRVRVFPLPAEITLPNGQKYTPSAGSMFVRYSPDAKHWSDWQALKHEDDDVRKKHNAVVFTGVVQVPRRQREEYERQMGAWMKLDTPWSSDEEALVKWIVAAQPDFFQEHKPFVGYVQFLYECGFHGGQRLTKLEAEAGWGVGGVHSIPKDEAVYKDRDVPWRFKAEADKKPE